MQVEINFLLKQLNVATNDAEKLKKEIQFLVNQFVVNFKEQPAEGQANQDKLLKEKDCLIQKQQEKIAELKKQVKSVAIEAKASIPASAIMQKLSGALKEQTDALKKEKELKYLDDMINIKQQQLRSQTMKQKNIKKSGQLLWAHKQAYSIHLI